MTPIIEERIPDTDKWQAAQRLNLHPLAARVLANRATTAQVAPEWLLDFSLHSLDTPDGLPDIEIAAQRLAQAIVCRERIALVTDADSDGVNANVVLTRGLTEHFGYPADLIQSFIGLKLTEGYGISEALCERILLAEPRPALIVTADIGSSDGPRIARLAAAGISVIVTDHHGIPPEGGPEAALAFVNPQRPDSQYPDPLIAGVMVAWLLLWATRRVLITTGQLAPQSRSLRYLLGWVATGTVADVVSLARSKNNRIVVHVGLPQIASGAYPCWRALRPYLGDLVKPLDAADLAFGIGPRINAAGRLHDAMAGVRFLLAVDDNTANEAVLVLNQSNLERRAIEQRLSVEAMQIAATQLAEQRPALIVPLRDGHVGVHGIVASRLVQNYARPAICLSQHQAYPELLSGSCRSIDGVSMLDALQHVAAQDSTLLLKYGGHAAAAGITLEEKRLPEFVEIFETYMAQRLRVAELCPRVWVDARAEARDLDLALVGALRAIGPYGREFSEPVFRTGFQVKSVREIGKEGGHWRLHLQQGRQRFEAIWFNVGSVCPVSAGDGVDFIYTPEVNWWQSKPRFQLRLHAIADQG